MIGHRSHVSALRAPDEPVVAANKEELRHRARLVRDAIPTERRSHAADSAAGHLVELPGLAAARRVAMFAAVGSELDPAAAVLRLRARGVEIVYPRVVRGARRLDFHLVTGDGELAPGAFGIPEPAPGAPVAPVHSIDAFVVPGLAFDAAGGRVGWGRGYYDRTLAASPERLRIGYCFDCQLVGEVPLEPCDLPMHLVVTESGVLVPS